tara:strand:+ start:579 stop:1211 length:633 start_codon:yes stop_codon:yes gene_type:complete
MPTQLQNSSGEYVTVESGESCNLSGTLKAATGATVTTITALTITLFDETTGAIINSRDSQDVNGANGGTFSSGDYTIALDSADTTAVGELEDTKSQNRIARIEFTYYDGDSTRKGIEEFFFPVYKPKTTSGIGSGANQITLTVTDSSGNPVPEATVYVTTDLAGQATVAGPVITTTSGVTPTLYLDAGTFYSWSEATNYTFTNPQKFTVS